MAGWTGLGHVVLFHGCLVLLVMLMVNILGFLCPWWVGGWVWLYMWTPWWGGKPKRKWWYIENNLTDSGTCTKCLWLCVWHCMALYDAISNWTYKTLKGSDIWHSSSLTMILLQVFGTDLNSGQINDSQILKIWVVNRPEECLKKS